MVVNRRSNRLARNSTSSIQTTSKIAQRQPSKHPSARSRAIAPCCGSEGMFHFCLQSPSDIFRLRTSKTLWLPRTPLQFPENARYTFTWLVRHEERLDGMVGNFDELVLHYVDRNVGSFMQRGVRSGGDEDEDISIADQVMMMFKSRGSGEGGFGVEG